MRNVKLSRGPSLRIPTLLLCDLAFVCLLPLSARPISRQAAAAIDTDRDGLAIYLEKELGTDPSAADTDGDFLTDYYEYCKYLTNPTKADTDGDGIPDGDWDERREYTYSIRAICEIQEPNQIKWMNDAFQDARSTDRKPVVHGATVVELVVFLHATPRIYPQPYDPTSTPRELEKYTRPSPAVNISPEMRKKVHEIVATAKTDLEAIREILDWIEEETEYEKDLPWFGRFHFRNGQISWFNSPGDHAAEKEYLETHFYADSMFKRRKHGACTAMATLRCAMLRAAGFPTRIIQTLPLINRYEGDYEPLVDRMRKRSMAGGFEWPVGRSGGANHTYNEVYLNNHWIRVDNSINVGPFVSKKLFVKVYSTACWDDLYPERSPEEWWNENRDFRTLEVSDRYPKHESDYLNIDLVVKSDDIFVYGTSEGTKRIIVNVHINGNSACEDFGIYFYSGDPTKGGKVIAAHGSGGVPHMAGTVHAEGTGPMQLADGEHTFFVVVDPGNRIREEDETNNTASRTFLIRGDTIREK